MRTGSARPPSSDPGHKRLRCGPGGWTGVVGGLHDLAIPGTQANIDHLVIGPGGVMLIDSKQYGGSCGWTATGWSGGLLHLAITALDVLHQALNALGDAQN